ncbi:hypothetical protein BDF14DRAFT_1857593 [Spinellus fusiger]|nr:hypothetical protein BDF14DRAFT_1857593 [Spinellus fusiger]
MSMEPTEAFSKGETIERASDTPKTQETSSRNTTPEPISPTQVLEQSSPPNSHPGLPTPPSGSTALNLSSSLPQINAAQAQAIAQAAAAAMAATGTNYHQLFANFDPTTPAVTSTGSNPTPNGNIQTMSAPQIATDLIKRELINQKVRADNRERKKRWRALNEERNKDNDLRCRVNKRANKLFGKNDIEPKQRWVEEEFLKRQAKRKEKERRKQIVDGAVSAHRSEPSHVSGLHLSGVTQQQQLTPQQIQTLQETNYLSMLCSNLGALSPNTAAKLLGTNGTTAKTPERTQQLSMQLVEFLQQLQQYQPQPSDHQQQQQQTLDSSDHIVPSLSQTGSEPNGQDMRPEEKLAALLTSSINAVAAAAAAAAAAANANAVTGEEDKSENGQIKKEQGDVSEQQINNGQPGVDYPMDAVLTLMQLNAGWRQ